MGKTETPEFKSDKAAKGQNPEVPVPADNQQELRKDWENFLVHNFKQHFPHLTAKPETLPASTQAKLEIFASQSEGNRNAVDLYYLSHGSPITAVYQDAKGRICDSISRISNERPDLVKSFVQLISDKLKHKSILKKEIEDYAELQEFSSSLIKSAQERAASFKASAASPKKFWRQMEHDALGQGCLSDDDMNNDRAYLALKDRILTDVNTGLGWTIPIKQEENEERTLRYAYRRDVTNVIPAFNQYHLKIKTQSLEPHEVQKLENFRNNPNYNSIVDNAFIIDLIMLRSSPPGSKESLRGLEGVLNVMDQKFAEYPGDTRLADVFTQCVLQSLAGERKPEGKKVNSDLSWAVSQIANHAKLWELAQIRLNDEISNTSVKGCFKPQTGEDGFSREP